MGKGSTDVGVWEVQTVGYKIDSRLYCTTWGIEPVFCNNCKWEVIFKNFIQVDNFKNMNASYCKYLSTTFPFNYL